MLGLCLVQFVLCVFILSSLWSHPLRINTHHGDGATTLYRRSRLDARHERASPIRLENFGLTGVVCWDTFKPPTSNKFILFIFVFIFFILFRSQNLVSPCFFGPASNPILPNYIHKHGTIMLSSRDLFWLSVEKKSPSPNLYQFPFVMHVPVAAGSYITVPAARLHHGHGAVHGACNPLVCSIWSNHFCICAFMCGRENNASIF